METYVLMHAFSLTAAPTVLQDKYTGLVLWKKPCFNLRTHPAVFGRVT
jgi:hypothetical protein